MTASCARDVRPPARPGSVPADGGTARPQLPEGDGWQYEPKWDGFRGVLENVGGELALWSRNERPLLRYFPELRPLGDLLPPKSALDGEIVIVRDGALDFDAMQMRLHPAESRIRGCPRRSPRSSSPSTCSSGTASRSGSSRSRSAVRARGARRASGSRRRPATSARRAAGSTRFEALGLDGVIAKRLGVPYLPGSREGVVKVKEHKTADCVVVGVRWKRRPQRDRDAPARALPRGRRARLRRLVRGRREDARRRRGARAAAARRGVRPAVLGAEPLGHRASSRRRPCGRSSWSRCATTRCRARASATARS